MNDKQLSAAELIEGMEKGKSVVLTFGEPGQILKRKITATGIASRLLLWLIFNPIAIFRATEKTWQKRRKAAVRIVRLFFPFYVKSTNDAVQDRGQVLVINHPTLNDPLCVLLYALKTYKNSRLVVPVNLPWFESICKYRQKLLKIGVNIVPILTPETAKRIGENERIAEVQAMLMANYMTELTETLAGGGVAIVAQQATRQRYLFASPNQQETGEGILATISFIMIAIKRAKILPQTEFIPVGVVPHSINAKSKLNLFRKYDLNIGESISGSELSAIKNTSKRPADFYMLNRLAELMPTEWHVSQEGNVK